MANHAILDDCREIFEKITSKLDDIDRRLDVRNCKDARNEGIAEGYKKAAIENRSATKRYLYYMMGVVALMEAVARIISYYAQ